MGELICFQSYKKRKEDEALEAEIAELQAQVTEILQDLGADDFHLMIYPVVSTSYETFTTPEYTRNCISYEGDWPLWSSDFDLDLDGYTDY